ncbi:CheR family methyltransferase [Pedobacter sp.]|uniref:CheR family methyltransferase n=1 Tax=Pedobacter sp. TaxID=1411316 RepID=UPI00396CBA69
MQIHTSGNSAISDQQFHELISLVLNVHGFDFNNYSEASLKRRIVRLMILKGYTFFELCNELINRTDFFQEFLVEVTVNVTEMFRDPGFYKVINKIVIPYLSTYQHIKIWSAGCSSGEELYSLAILFDKAGLYKRSFIYGTDINTKELVTAKEGIYDLQKMKRYSENLLQVDGSLSLSDYYTAKYDAALISRSLKKNILFSTHNLVSDGPFNEFQLITCRNVLIYFNAELQKKVINLFYNSLANLGFLCLGSKETIRDTDILKKLKVVDKKFNVYQKIA